VRRIALDGCVAFALPPRLWRDMRVARRQLLLCGALGIALLAGRMVAAEDGVDLALVLAVDVSGSITDERFRLQMRGYAEALVDPRVVDAIRSGPRQAIAITVVQWAGPTQQAQTIEWARVADITSAQRFAAAVAEAPRRFGGITSIAPAIDYAARLLQRPDFADARRVIDVSGDGASNGGPPPAPARDAAVALGVTINGLAILTEEPDLEAHYRNEVVGGQDAFVLAVEDLSSFPRAVIRKLVAEIAGTTSQSRAAFLGAAHAARRQLSASSSFMPASPSARLTRRY
jgi:hypothetical protein